MPNHVVNELIFRGMSEESKSKLLSFACNKDGEIDFEVLLPTPLNSWPGSVESAHQKAFPYTDLDWCAANWGTKWNAYSQSVEMNEDCVTFTFQTAWRPPYGWLVAVFRSLKSGFEHNWMSEGDGEAINGIWNYDQLEKMFGEAWKESPADETTKRRLHKILWGVEEF